MNPRYLKLFALAALIASHAFGADNIVLNDQQGEQVLQSAERYFALNAEKQFRITREALIGVLHDIQRTPNKYPQLSEPLAAILRADIDLEIVDDAELLNERNLTLGLLLNAHGIEASGRESFEESVLWEARNCDNVREEQQRLNALVEQERKESETRYRERVSQTEQENARRYVDERQEVEASYQVSSERYYDSRPTRKQIVYDAVKRGYRAYVTYKVVDYLLKH